MRGESLPILSITVFFGNRKKTSARGRSTTDDKNVCVSEGSVLPEAAAVAHLACRFLEEIVDVLMGLGL